MSDKIDSFDPMDGLFNEYDLNSNVVTTKMLGVNIVTLENYRGLPPMTYATADSSGFDLFAAFGEIDGKVILNKSGQTGCTKLISTGFRMELPRGFEGQVRPRSGLALKHGVTVLNSPGTIDADYRGEIKVLLHNTSSQRFEVVHGMRIAQMVIAPVTMVALNYKLEEELSSTSRGNGGFGSTGI